ncbi:MAG: vanadium-dependent haloperoxidase [Saprospiraceae bacterium]|nr:vanadium-dependent haloperoxidase [Saprospiraceae bacterium]
MMKTTPRLLKNAVPFLFSIFFLLLSGCKKDETDFISQKITKEYSSEVIQQWNHVFIDLERYAQGFRPCPAPRAMAYIGLACYEACVKDMPAFKSIRYNYPGLNIPQQLPLKDYHYPMVINAIYSRLLTDFMGNVKGIPTNSFVQISALYNKLKNDYLSEASGETIFRSEEYGLKVAQAVFEYSKTDIVGHNHHLDPFKDNIGNYKPQAVPGSFKPTNAVGPGMFPDYGYARTFVIKDADKLIPGPIPYSEEKNSPYYVQGAEVYAAVNNPTPDQRWMAFFWSDDLTGLTFSPPTRWLAIANQVYELDNVDLETAVYANAKVGIALNDCVVACWYSKYFYNIQRPVDYIRKVFRSNWQPALYNPLTKETGISPNFPAYPSGHSTMGGAAAEVLTDIFGNYYPMTDRCHEGRQDFEGSAPRHFNSFYEMANENAISRIPLGVHFRMDCDQGVNLGIRVGRKVNQFSWKKG